MNNYDFISDLAGSFEDDVLDGTKALLRVIHGILTYDERKEAKRKENEYRDSLNSYDRIEYDRGKVNRCQIFNGGGRTLF